MQPERSTPHSPLLTDEAVRAAADWRWPDGERLDVTRRMVEIVIGEVLLYHATVGREALVERVAGTLESARVYPSYALAEEVVTALFGEPQRE